MDKDTERVLFSLRSDRKPDLAVIVNAKTPPSCPLRTPYHTDYRAVLRNAEFGSPMAYYADRMWTSQPPSHTGLFWKLVYQEWLSLKKAIDSMVQCQRCGWEDMFESSAVRACLAAHTFHELLDTLAAHGWDPAKALASKGLKATYKPNCKGFIVSKLDDEPSDGAYAD